MLYFILNPSSRSRNSLAVWRKIRPLLEEKQIHYRVFATHYPGHAAKIARRISGSDPGSTLTVIGGDGTIHEVLTGLTRPDAVTLGVIPAGSGNDFARGMGLSSDPWEALQSILAPRQTVMMDTGLAETDEWAHPRRFGVSAGIGFDAAVCQEAQTSGTKNALNRLHLGSLTYSAIAAREIIRCHPGRMEISVDGGPGVCCEKVYFTAVMNQKYEGGGLMMTPGALPDDGRFEIFVCGDISRTRLVTALPLTKFGAHTGIPGPHYLHGRTISIRTDKKRPIHLDGESGGSSDHLTITMESEKLPVIIR